MLAYKNAATSEKIVIELLMTLKAFYDIQVITYFLCYLGVTSIEKIPKISASGRNFQGPPSSKRPLIKEK